MSVLVTIIVGASLIVVGVILIIIMGVLGKNKSFGYTKIFGYYGTCKIINGKYGNYRRRTGGNTVYCSRALIVFLG